jgi:hypothetical protein
MRPSPPARAAISGIVTAVPGPPCQRQGQTSAAASLSNDVSRRFRYPRISDQVDAQVKVVGVVPEPVMASVPSQIGARLLR